MITTILPDVLVEGGDYTINTIVGAKVEVLPLVERLSTTNILKKIETL